MTNIIEDILIRRDGCSSEEAMDLMSDCYDAICEGNFDAMQEYLGLEDDYIFDLLDRFI